MAQDKDKDRLESTIDREGKRNPLCVFWQYINFSLTSSIPQVDNVMCASSNRQRCTYDDDGKWHWVQCMQRPHNIRYIFVFFFFFFKRKVWFNLSESRYCKSKMLWTTERRTMRKAIYSNRRCITLFEVKRAKLKLSDMRIKKNNIKFDRKFYNNECFTKFTYKYDQLLENNWTAMAIQKKKKWKK